MEFQALFPTADTVLALPPKELGIRMLPVLQRWPEDHLFDLSELLERVAGDRPNAFPLASYPSDRRQKIRSALEDAWRWLEREGIIEPNTGGGSSSRLGRRGRALSGVHEGEPDAMTSDRISEEGRRKRFEHWEKLGLDRVKADLHNGGHQFIGGSPAVRDLAWEWVRGKEQTPVSTKFGRDKELIRALMLRLEGILRPGATTVLSGYDSELALEGYTSEQINHHLSLLVQLDYVDLAGSQPAIGAALRGLTPKGYDFLDRNRDGLEEMPHQLVKAQLPRKVFIVHGHDEGTRESVARFLERLGFVPIILHEQPNKGRTIITKFREEANDVGFAVVLMTPDDHGAKQSADTRPRARQNVVFELGFFIGALGPERVAALMKGDVEHPSDFDGVVYISLDQGQWKIDLANELKAAGFDVDFNKVLSA